jgi:4-amino-4-deoxy-L-arabinose transferase-like glycosyltransferase
VEPARDRLHLAIALAAVSAWIATALVTWVQRAPLGHDEAQYALAARDHLAGLPPRWFYVSRGMDALAIPGLWLGGTEGTLRLVPLLGGIGFVGALWLLARRTVGRPGAAWALAIVVGTRAIARRSTDLLSDMPAAACLVAALAIIVDEIDREDGARWRIVLVAPLLAAALYVRYGSAVPIAIIVVASLATGARTLRRRPAPVLATVALFLVLLVPHFVSAYVQTGSPLGILLASRGVPHQAHVYEGLVTYLTSNPLQYYGIAAAFAMIAGLTALRGADPRRLLVWLVGVGSLVAMGLTTHAMTRYVMLSIALLVVLGAGQLVRWLESAIWHQRRLWIVLGLGALATIWLLLTIRQAGSGTYRRGTMRGTLVAAQVIRGDARGRPCTVIGYQSTQLEWYSGCRTTASATGELTYVVRDHSPGWIVGRQPVLAELPGVPFTLFRLPALEVVRLDPTDRRRPGP